MKVTMKLSVSSVDTSYATGLEYDLPEALAKQWVKAGYAEPVEEVLVEETPVAAIEEPAIAVEETPAPVPAATPRRGRKSRNDTPKSDLL